MSLALGLFVDIVRSDCLYQTKKSLVSIEVALKDVDGIFRQNKVL